MYSANTGYLYYKDDTSVSNNRFCHCRQMLFKCSETILKSCQFTTFQQLFMQYLTCKFNFPWQNIAGTPECNYKCKQCCPLIQGFKVYKRQQALPFWILPLNTAVWCLSHRRAQLYSAEKRLLYMKIRYRMGLPGQPPRD